MQQSDIIIVGAGAAGLMAARELSKKGRKVVVLEARDRIGGRIYSLEKKFGYPAQGGAEYVHGKAPVTHALAKKAGVKLFLTKGDMWNAEDGKVTINGLPIPNQKILHEKLRELKRDLPIAEFLDKNFSDEKYAEMRSSIIRMVQGYDAADPKKMSTFSLREEWLGGGNWLQYRIKEGYGAMLSFLESECAEQGVKIILDEVVREINWGGEAIRIRTNTSVHECKKVVLTVPVPLLPEIKFIPAIPKKLEAVSDIGFGGVIKILIKFRDRWWVNARGKDFSEMDFIFSREPIATWWTQFPDLTPVLTGWLAGPAAEKFKHMADSQILDTSIVSLSNIFGVDPKKLRKDIVNYQVVNWIADPFARGAYSYPTPETQKAIKELSKPVNNKIFFAGEAIYSGQDTATVEGAFASGLETARRILDMKD